MTLRVFEAFAGYGSQHMALQQLSRECPDFSFEVVGIAEIDKYAIQAYTAAHGAQIPNYGDISKINWGQMPDFDFFTYSFPCQDISQAGKQRGLSEGSGTRSSLLWECEKAIRIKRPKFLLMENVKALTQKKHMPDFLRWQSLLEGMGYTNYWQVLNAKHYGVPQNRERCFMVSVYNAVSHFYFPRPIPLEKRLKDVLETEVDEKYYLKAKQVKGTIDHCARKQAEGCGFKTNFQTPNGVSGAIKTKEGSREYDTYIVEPIGADPEGCAYALTTKCGNVSATNLLGSSHYPMTGVIEYHALNCHDDGTCRCLKAQYAKNGCMNFRRHDAFGATGVMAVGDISHSRLRKMFEDGKIDPEKILFINAYNKTAREDVAGTITTRVDRSDHTWLSIPAGGSGCVRFVRVRKLTPTECFRLMGVPRRYIDRMVAAGISNCQLYKLAGNSIVVDVLTAIFRNMFANSSDSICSVDSNGQYRLF